MQAYAWISIAAAQGIESAKESKDIVAERMTRAQIAEAQKLSREYWEDYGPGFINKIWESLFPNNRVITQTVFIVIRSQDGGKQYNQDTDRLVFIGRLNRPGNPGDPLVCIWTPPFMQQYMY